MKSVFDEEMTLGYNPLLVMNARLEAEVAIGNTALLVEIVEFEANIAIGKSIVERLLP